jgi:hypothetical protein
MDCVTETYRPIRQGRDGCRWHHQLPPPCRPLFQSSILGRLHQINAPKCEISDHRVPPRTPDPPRLTAERRASAERTQSPMVNGLPILQYWPRAGATIVYHVRRYAPPTISPTYSLRPATYDYLLRCSTSPSSTVTPPCSAFVPLTLSRSSLIRTAPCTKIKLEIPPLGTHDGGLPMEKKISNKSPSFSCLQQRGRAMAWAHNDTTKNPHPSTHTTDPIIHHTGRIPLSLTSSLTFLGGTHLKPSVYGLFAQYVPGCPFPTHRQSAPLLVPWRSAAPHATVSSAAPISVSIVRPGAS